jgi:acyl-lipid omega-3 desaturase
MADVPVALRDELAKERVFEKSVAKSFLHLGVDVAAIALLIAFRSSIPYFIYINVLGFFLWCLFVVGHDCGHTTFSNSTLLNDVVGNLTHGFLIVPFYAWQHSHRMHHTYHNHQEKDKSHAWLIEDQKKWNGSVFFYLFPFLSYYAYLSGLLDGSHFFPFCNFIPAWKSFVSTASAILVPLATTYLFLTSFFWDLFVPLMVFNAWLVIVTYHQHHHEKTVVYDEKSWTFLLGAQETVDRSYGYLIDQFSHHITDGHIAHHLFFTKIPHYNLPKATEIVYKHLPGLKVEKHAPYIGFLVDYAKYVIDTFNLVRKGDKPNIYVPFF